MVTVDCSSGTYSEDEFEFSVSPASSVFQSAGHNKSDEDSDNDDSVSNSTTGKQSYDDSTLDERSQDQTNGDEQSREEKGNEEGPTPPTSTRSATVSDKSPSLSSNNRDRDGATAGGEASPEPLAYSSFGSPTRSDEGEPLLPSEGEAVLPTPSPSVLVIEQDSRTAKQVTIPT